MLPDQMAGMVACASRAPCGVQSMESYPAVRGALKRLQILLGKACLPAVLFIPPLLQQAAAAAAAARARAPALRGTWLRASSGSDRPGKPPFFTGTLSSPWMSRFPDRQLPFMRTDFSRALKKPASFNSSPSLVLCVLLGRYCMIPFKLSAARLSTWQGGRAVSGQMFSFCGQKAGLGKGACARGTS